MSIFGLFKSREEKLFEQQRNCLISSRIKLCNMSKEYATQPRDIRYFSEIKVPRILFRLLNGLKIEKLTLITILYLHSPTIEDFEASAKTLFKFTSTEEFENYKNSARSIAFIIKLKFNGAKNDEELGDLIFILYNKFPKNNYISLTSSKEDPEIKSDERFLLDIFDGDFTVRIEPSKFVDAENNVYMRHGDQYSIFLFNDNEFRRASVEIFIDNIKVGRFRIESDSGIRIERPVNDTGKFTFYEYGTPEGFHSGIHRGMGFISCRFYLEKLESDDIRFSLKEGGTGLSGESEQQFRTAEYMETESDFTEIKLRLVSQSDTPRKINPVE